MRSSCKACDQIAKRLAYKPRENPKHQRKHHIFEIRTREELRECSDCGTWCSLGAFYLHGGVVSNICKSCSRARSREQSKARYHESPARARAYALEHSEHIKRRMAKWREKNRERLLAYNRTTEKQAYSRELMRQKRQSGEAQAYQREYARRFPEKGAEKRAERRARMAGSAVEPISRTAIIQRDGRWCYLCGKYLKWREVTLDHVVSLANGGPHIAANLRVACGPCNSRKGKKSRDEYQAYLQLQPPAPTLAQMQASLL